MFRIFVNSFTSNLYKLSEIISFRKFHYPKNIKGCGVIISSLVLESSQNYCSLSFLIIKKCSISISNHFVKSTETPEIRENQNGQPKIEVDEPEVANGNGNAVNGVKAVNGDENDENEDVDPDEEEDPLVSVIMYII